MQSLVGESRTGSPGSRLKGNLPTCKCSDCPLSTFHTLKPCFFMSPEGAKSFLKSENFSTTFSEPFVQSRSNTRLGTLALQRMMNENSLEGNFSSCLNQIVCPLEPNDLHCLGKGPSLLAKYMTRPQHKNAHSSPGQADMQSQYFFLQPITIT